MKTKILGLQKLIEFCDIEFQQRATCNYYVYFIKHKDLIILHEEIFDGITLLIDSPKDFISDLGREIDVSICFSQKYLYYSSFDKYVDALFFYKKIKKKLLKFQSVHFNGSL
jgi:hypothetical protein